MVPVKLVAQGKTRLAGTLEPAARGALVTAMALDTLASVAATQAVGRVVLVTDDPGLRRAVVDLPGAWVHVMEEPDGGGLNPALAAGIREARQADPGHGVAVVLADLPGLRPHDLEEVLRAAAAHPRSVVNDAEGTGTTVLAALPGVDLEPRFGPGSAAAHRAAGHVALVLPEGSPARQDVDLPADLASVGRIGVGPRTRAVLDRWAGRPTG
ncbi:2-phospho-L-lactate guanylyltransferase [Actinotalea sp. K2]|uniref:2-phospho-L-lactate guanylyltransferase n=1 Tax=Actinotalea sp. K2 TaxID=2939438 RepID=UPI002017C879|nr:2-phospho-L-lactate guanylyltransferase [Actinotalea sp. K2]MCL3860288.1 2-phospho-L-lactate guanylyltransferase [Actinotalea sp. K2]